MLREEPLSPPLHPPTCPADNTFVHLHNHAQVIYLDGFTEEQLDYIINYDIKYRTGLG